MGKSKRGFNWKARHQSKGEVDQTTSEALKDRVDIQVKNETAFQGTNELVLPTQKRKFKKAKEEQAVGRILSKKQRKKLERIVDVKKKKAGREELLQKLQDVQVDSKILDHMTSLSAIQTKGLKRQFAEDEWKDAMVQQGVPVETVEAEMAPGKKKIKLKRINQKEKKVQSEDPNVLGFESSSEEEESDEEGGEESEHLDDESQKKEIVEESKPSPSKKEERVETKAESSVQKSQDKPKKVVEKKSYRKTVYVPIERTPEIQELREKLPIIAEEHAIMEAINDNPVVILSGETGSGKTTQVPQFLFEAGYAENGKMIGVTEPRRVAAMSMSKRVGVEMDMPKKVSYQIRFEGNTTEDTKIKFMTDGVLLKEIEKDFLLTRYSAIIIDEAHERSVFTDILIGLLSRIGPLRHKKNDPLKLIIMSATLRVTDFTENSSLFKTVPPVIHVQSRQYDVTAKFNKTTAEDYMAEAFRKVCKIHRKLPEGGILVFVTGQQEVNQLVKKLRSLFGGGKVEEEEEVEEGLQKALKCSKKGHGRSAEAKRVLPKVDLDSYEILPLDDTETDVLGDEEDDLVLEDADVDEFTPNRCLDSPMWVLPLYSMLSSDRQAKVFEPVPDGHRLCVIATNIAETSLTIPGIKYVVDTGKVKKKFYDRLTGVSSFYVDWTSKANAMQRAGRAGRQGPGHCYRLYSSAVFNDEFTDHTPPEILLRPIEDLVLQMKSMNIDKVRNFPFPTPPEKEQIERAETHLMRLGALKGPPKNLSLKEIEKLMLTSKVTNLGRAIATFPVSPRFGKMLALSHQHGLLPYTITMVASLSVQEVLIEVGEGQERSVWAELRKKWAGQGHSLLLGDPMVLMRAVCAAEFAGSTPTICEQFGLRHKALMEVRKIRKQLTDEVNLILPGMNLAVDPHLKPPTDLQAKMLRQIVLAGSPNEIARKIDPEDMKDPEDRKRLRSAYKCFNGEDQPVFMRNASVLRSKLPEWIVFQDLKRDGSKTVMSGITAIESEWIPLFTECSYSKPLDAPAPSFDAESGQVFCHVRASFGGVQLPVVEAPFPEGLDKFKWFAQFVLDGSVLPRLAPFASELLAPPTTMTKYWGHLQSRTENILKELVNNKVDSRSRLVKMLGKDETFLRKAYLQWVPEKLHERVIKVWPPVDL